LTPIRQIETGSIGLLPQALDLSACFGCSGSGSANSTETNRTKDDGESCEVRPRNVVQRADEAFNLTLAPVT
jgi:hypothetical protein